MSTTSILPSQWADKPWPIMKSPQGDGHDINSHYAVYIATTMCHVHNMLIRAMNSIYLQSPHVTEPQDIADLLFYTKTLVTTIHAHHESEENHLFPALAKYTKNPTLMAGNLSQHATFHTGLETLHTYSTTTPPTSYSSTILRSIIDSFATELFTHLNDEIATLLALQQYESEGLKGPWSENQKHANDTGTFDEILPLALGCVDKGFEGGIHKFPPVPWFVPYVVNYWFARKHRGAWRFNPCDAWGNPRELAFRGEET